jgi:nucleoside-diphosphate-sugar epimerase
MKVFIAGATGAIGHPLISRLVAAGHDVVGMTSSERGLQTLREAGAEEVVANALDAQAARLSWSRGNITGVIPQTPRYGKTVP